MKKYDKYKNSGISWIEELPEHWKKRKMKFVFSEKSQKGFPNEPVLCSTQSHGVIPQSMYENRVVVVNKGFENLKLVCKGDYVISLRSFQGGIEYAHYRGIISAAYTILALTSKLLLPEFVKLLFKSLAFIQLLKTCVIGIREGQNINYPLLKNKFIPIPPLVEQQSIVSYLNKKCSDIETYIETKQKELNALEELRMSLVSKAVTKGLNDGAPMKDSGISWIGEVPEDWEKRKIKFVFSERSQKGFPNEPILCSTQSYGVIPQSMYENRVVVVNKDFEKLKLVCKGDYVISLRSFQGGIEYAYYRGIISAAYTIITLTSRLLLPDFLKLLFKSNAFIQLLKTCVTGIREGQNINYPLLKNKFIPIPPLTEQQSIVSYLNKKNDSIDKMKSGIESQIAALKEYKQRLISDVVTGKIKVTD